MIGELTNEMLTTCGPTRGARAAAREVVGGDDLEQSNEMPESVE
jgi:hypothetical protein